MASLAVGLMFLKIYNYDVSLVLKSAVSDCSVKCHVEEVLLFGVPNSCSVEVSIHKK